MFIQWINLIKKKAVITFLTLREEYRFMKKEEQE